MVMGAIVANADPFGGIDPGAINAIQNASGRSFYDVQQLQNKAESTKGSYSEFKDFKQQQQERQEQVKREMERQKRLEERVEQVTPQAQFVNDNGVIRIENQ